MFADRDRKDITRRHFIGATAAYTAASFFPQRAASQSSQPKRGGHLILGVSQGSATDSLDSATWNSVFPNTAGAQLYDTLTFVDEKMQVKPGLAESWEFKPGARVWVFKLRKGVTFHNGKTLTAADVVYSINRHRGKDSKSVAKGVVSAFEDVVASSPDEVTITLSGGNVDLPYLIADWHLQIGPEGLPFNGVGTGAFVLESFEPGVRARTRRNPNDYRSDRGYVDTVETLAMNDATARINALLSGSVHIIDRISGAVIGMLENSPQARIVSVAGGWHSTMPMVADRPPYNNLDLRLALKYAIDREAVLRTALRGHGRLANDHPVPSYDPMYAADIPQRAYDPDKARFHYRKSGYDGPIVLTMSDIAMNAGLEIVQLFQDSAKKVGIDLQISRQSSDGYYAKYFGTGAAPFYASSWGGRPTADLIMTACYSSASPLNESLWKNEKFDQILVAARAEPNTAKRKQMYHDLQLMIRDEGATIIPTHQNFVEGASKSIGGFVGSPLNILSCYRVAEQVWLNA